MAPRKVGSTLPQKLSKPSAKKGRKRRLDAFAIAGKVTSQKDPVRKHRLGEIERDNTTRKRQADSDDEDDQDEERPRKRRQAEDDSDVEHGSDSEGHEWTLGDVGDDDDESIDSDEAFGESDEERFEDYTFRGSSTNKNGSTKSKKRNTSSAAKQASPEFNLDEDEEEEEEEEEDDFGEDGVDLATMLDADDESDEEDEDEPDMMDDESSEDEDDSQENDDAERNARLRDLVDSLDNTNKNEKSTEDTDAGLSLEDLLKSADLDDETLAALQPKKSAKSAQLLSAPLPQRQQNAIDRKVATKKAKEQLDRWQDSVIQNRRAEFLSFPLTDPSQAAKASTNTFTNTQQDAPANELEASIQKIMEESGMLSKSSKKDVDPGEHDLLRAEELETQHIPVEEVMQRRAELRKHRALMFQEEIKAKRLAKIKSKAYRRVHRKERERLADKERMLMDPEGYAEGRLDEAEQELADRRRAEARMSAKHRDSKWAKSLRATDRAVWDDNARQGVVEQARRQEELKRRIAGADIRGDDESESDVDDGEDAVEVLRKLAAEKEAGPEAKGIAGMKFMQRAAEKRRKENDEAMAELRGDYGLNEDKEADEIDDEGLGRAIFGPKPSSGVTAQPQEERLQLEEGHGSEDEEASAEVLENVDAPAKSVSEKPAKSKKNQKPLFSAMPTSNTPAEQPEAISEWLAAPSGKKSKLDRKLARQDENVALIDTNLDEVVSAPKKTTHKTASVADKSAFKTDVNGEDAAETDQEAPLLTQAEQNAAFHARAFAADDVALQFADEKNDQAVSEDEKEVNTSMPGWGAWTGEGLSKSNRKAAARAKHNPLYKTKLPGTKAKDRRDANLDNVIISEKQDRKGKKYLAPILPHQFERKIDYERSLRMPIGPEWQTKEVVQRNTRPRVVVKPGTIIEPMSRPLV